MNHTGTLMSVIVLSAGLTAVAETGELKPFYSEKMVFAGSERYPSSHGSTVLELPDGGLLCAWYAGSREKGNDVVILGARLARGAASWSKVQVWADTPDKSEGNPVLYLAADRRVWGCAKISPCFQVGSDTSV